ncbi:MAG: folylpolyglutamate synthase/dihydrofolate synthase family protein [Planctomycetota bacterium]
MNAPARFAALEALLAQRTNFERTPPARGFELERVREVSRRLGEPGHAYPVVHVAGTCGKGTTAALAAAAADLAGLRVGLTTSPHLVCLRERVRLGPAPASDERWLAAAREVLAAEDPREPLTYFELVVLVALVAFRAAQVDLAVVEVGLGGRLDATRVVAPTVCAIARIARDHTELLGHDEASIAAEKAGILVPGVPVVAAPGHPEAARVIAARAAELGCPLWSLGDELGSEPAPSEPSPSAPAQGGLRVRWPGGEVRCPTGPDHLGGDAPPGWEANLALAAGALARLTPSLGGAPLAALPAAASALRWRGRFEVVTGAPGGPPESQPVVVLDGAHDAVAAAALRAAWERRFGATRAQLMFALAREKDRAGVIAALAPLAAEVTVCAIHGARSADPAELAAAFRALGVAATTEVEPERALAAALARARAEGRPLLVCGSLHLTGWVLGALGEDVRAAWGGAKPSSARS